MDEKKLLEFISKHYEWTYPYISSEQGDIERITPCNINARRYKFAAQNPQLGPRIIKPKLGNNLRACEWCHQICDQKTLHTVRFTSIDGRRPDRRWEHSCQTCKKIWDPKLGKLKEKPKSAYMQAKEDAEKGIGIPRPYWWKTPGSDNDKLG